MRGSDDDRCGIDGCRRGFDEHRVREFNAVLDEFCVLESDDVVASVRHSFARGNDRVPGDRIELVRVFARHVELARVKGNAGLIVPHKSEGELESDAVLDSDDDRVLLRDVDDIIHVRSERHFDVGVLRGGKQHGVNGCARITFRGYGSARRVEREFSAHERVDFACKVHILCADRVSGHDDARIGSLSVRQHAELTAHVDDDRPLRDVEALIVLDCDDVVGVDVKQRRVGVEVVLADAFTALSAYAVARFIDVEDFAAQRLSADCGITRRKDFGKHFVYASRRIRKLTFAHAELELGIGIAVRLGSRPGVNGDATRGDGVIVAHKGHRVVFDCGIVRVVDDEIGADRVNLARIEVRNVECKLDGYAFACHIGFFDTFDIIGKHDRRAVFVCRGFCGYDRSALDDAVIYGSENLISALVHGKVVRDVAVVVFGDINVDFVVAGFDGYEVHRIAVNDLGKRDVRRDGAVFRFVKQISALVNEAIHKSRFGRHIRKRRRHFGGFCGVCNAGVGHRVGHHFPVREFKGDVCVEIAESCGIVKYETQRRHVRRTEHDIIRKRFVCKSKALVLQIVFKQNDGFRPVFDKLEGDVAVFDFNAELHRLTAFEDGCHHAFFVRLGNGCGCAEFGIVLDGRGDVVVVCVRKDVIDVESRHVARLIDRPYVHDAHARLFCGDKVESESGLVAVKHYARLVFESVEILRQVVLRRKIYILAFDVQNALRLQFGKIFDDFHAVVNSYAVCVVAVDDIVVESKVNAVVCVRVCVPHPSRRQRFVVAVQ